ncbi:MAG: type III pantothenate kinase [Gammaproteobacteria bacterium]
MLLLIDIGNTRIKAAAWHGGELEALPALPTAAATDWRPWLADLRPSGQPRRVLVSNVAGIEVAGELARHVFDTWGIEAEFVVPTRRCHGMTTSYREPARLGVDRWLAALAAWHLHPGAVAVVDLGTALTIDVVDTGGRHLGGLIAPGLELMRTSLTRGTAQLASTGIAAVAGFGTNTEDGISLGCWSAVAGLLRETRARVNRTPGCDDAVWFLTGGGASDIQGMFDWPVQCSPDLVLRGLVVSAGEAL